VLGEGRFFAIGTPDEAKINPDPPVQQFLNASFTRRFAASVPLQPVVPTPIYEAPAPT
jgi:hypothetical protein